MSLFNNWLGKKTPGKLPGRSEYATPSEEAGELASHGEKLGGDEKVSSRKSQRMERREALYAVVRECMVRMGVLTTGYRFRVLSMDAGGRQYMIMMDVNRELGENASEMKSLESLLGQIAADRHDLVVTALYWRINEDLTSSGHRARNPEEKLPAQPQPTLSGANKTQTQGAKETVKNKAGPKKTEPRDFAQTQMMDEKEIRYEKADFESTQMMDFGEINATGTPKRK